MTVILLFYLTLALLIIVATIHPTKNVNLCKRCDLVFFTFCRPFSVIADLPCTSNTPFVWKNDTVSYLMNPVVCSSNKKNRNRFTQIQMFTNSLYLASAETFGIAIKTIIKSALSMSHCLDRVLVTKWRDVHDYSKVQVHNAADWVTFKYRPQNHLQGCNRTFSMLTLKSYLPGKKSLSVLIN